MENINSISYTPKNKDISGSLVNQTHTNLHLGNYFKINIEPK